MVPIPVSHPSDVEVRELRAISEGLICEAACTGYASSRFHGFRVAAIRESGAASVRIDLLIEHDGTSVQIMSSWSNAPQRTGHGHSPFVGDFESALTLLTQGVPHAAGQTRIRFAAT